MRFSPLAGLSLPNCGIRPAMRSRKPVCSRVTATSPSTAARIGGAASLTPLSAMSRTTARPPALRSISAVASIR